MTAPAARDLVAYLAGPEVFLPNAVDIGARKIAICREHGIDARFPFEPFDSTLETPAERGHEIFEACIAMMDQCTLVIANMTPFRGASMDVGTAVEIGYMHAKGHPVFGYSNDVRSYDLRVPRRDGRHVEGFGFADNLMVEGPVWKSRGSVISSRVPERRRLSDLRNFIACVEQAVGVLGTGP